MVTLLVGGIHLLAGGSRFLEKLRMVCYFHLFSHCWWSTQNDESGRYGKMLITFFVALCTRKSKDSMLIGAVMSSCERGHQWVRCLQLLSRCFAMHCPPDLPMLTSCISACGKSHRWEAMVELLREAGTDVGDWICGILMFSSLALGRRWGEYTESMII